MYAVYKQQTYFRFKHKQVESKRIEKDKPWLYYQIKQTLREKLPEIKDIL